VAGGISVSGVPFIPFCIANKKIIVDLEIKHKHSLFICYFLLSVKPKSNVINVHSTIGSSRFHYLIGVINKPTRDELYISPVYRRLAVAKFSESTM